MCCSFYPDAVVCSIHATKEDATKMKNLGLASYKTFSPLGLTLVDSVLPFASGTHVINFNIALPPKKYIPGLFEVPFWLHLSRSRPCMNVLKWTAPEMMSVVKR
jgi:hypothetical protein